MRKLLNIAFKDLLVAFRDPSGMALMLIAPFAITLAMAFAFGRLTGGSQGGLSDIPVIIVNHDIGQFSPFIAQAFESDELADLVAPAQMTDEAAARALIDADQAAAVVIVPSNFSESILPTGGGAAAVDPRRSTIEIYSSPTRSISAGIVRGIVDQVLAGINAGRAGATTAVTQLVAGGLIAPQDAQRVGQEVGARVGQQVAGSRRIAVKGEAAGADETAGFDWMGFMAPSMAIMFLMFTAANGGRSLLAERDWGTLPRLLATPTSAAQVIGGKIGGTFLMGLAQMSILIVVSTVFFNLKWGALEGVAVLTLALVIAATSWGTLLAAYARTPGQANAVGIALSLVFGGLAGNFVVGGQTLPQPLNALKYITPNAWGLEGFTQLASGGGLADVAPMALALLVMSAALFVVSLVAFRRQYT